MGRTLGALLTFVIVIFVGAMGFFYIQEGSFEDAGARMDDALVILADNTEEAVNEAGDATEAFVEDLQDDEPQ